MRGHDRDGQSVPDDRGAPARPVHGGRDPFQLVGEGAVEDPRRRGHVGAEEVDADPAESTEGAEAGTLALRRVDRRRPVGRDAELVGTDREPLPGRGEDDRLVRERRGAVLEQRPRVRRLEAADVDPVDSHALGDLRRRSCEDETEHEPGRDDRGREQEQPPDDRRPGRPAPAGSSPRGRLRRSAHLGDGSPRFRSRHGSVPLFSRNAGPRGYRGRDASDLRMITKPSRSPTCSKPVRS